MKPSKLTYAKCPECKITINDDHCYPLATLTSEHPFYHKMKCPSCKKTFPVRLVVTWQFITDDSEIEK
jgi:hypothetical protein